MGHLQAATLSPEGQWFTPFAGDEHVAVWQCVTSMLVRTLQRGVSETADFFCVAIRCAAWSPDGTLLATGGRDGSTIVWEVAACAVKLTLHSPLPEVKVYSVAWSPRGLQICTGSDDGVARLWDADTGHLVHELAAQSGSRGYARWLGALTGPSWLQRLSTAQ